MEECSDKNIAKLAITNSISLNFKEQYDRTLTEYEKQHQGSQRKAWTSKRISEVINIIKKGQVTMTTGKRRTAMTYYWMSKYDIVTTANEEYLAFKRQTPTAPIVHILPKEKYFDVLLDIHLSCGHGGRDKILSEFKTKYYIPKKAVEIFVSLCPLCESKRNAPKKRFVPKPIVSPDFNLRGQVDLIDFQSCSDGEFKWLLVYQDNTTKFLNLRPLKTGETIEVASELMKIFLIFGAPYILQSYNDREFIANVIRELAVVWPECKIVHGDPPQTQDAVERSNQEVENNLRTWMNENKSTKWSVGCFFVQYSKNASQNQIIGKSPYKALFGNEPTAGLSGSDIPPSILATIETEEQLKSLSKQQSNEGTSVDCGKSDTSKSVIENTKNESNVTCTVCHADVSGATKCESCQSVVHPIWEVTVEEMSVEEREDKPDIKIETDCTPQGFKRAAEIMIDTNIKKRKLDIGDSVSVSVPKVDRGPQELKNIQGRIVYMNNGVYKIATKCGTIKNWFSQKELQHSDKNYGEELSDTPISLRDAVESQSHVGDQGLQKCNCKPAVNQCRNNRCACFKKKTLCGPNCHDSATCVNK